MEKRKGSSIVGFGANVQEKAALNETGWMQDVVAHDLVKFGIIPELVGRVPVITALNGLDTDALVRILSEPKNSLVKQYKKLFLLDGVDLEFTDDALVAVANIAKEQKTGARGLRGIMEGILNDLMFEVPSDNSITSITITEDVVNKKAEPIIERGRKRKSAKTNLISKSNILEAEEVS